MNTQATSDLLAETINLKQIISAQRADLKSLQLETVSVREEVLRYRDDIDRILAATSSIDEGKKAEVNLVLVKMKERLANKNFLATEISRLIKNTDWEKIVTIRTDEVRERLLDYNNKKRIENGLKPIDKREELHGFNSPLSVVLNAIEEKTIIEGINISEEIKKPFFRFVTVDNAELSYNISRVISIVYKEARNLNPDIAELGRQKSKDNADLFAKEMHDIVTRIQREEDVSTYRDTVKALNEKHIPTYRGGEWHIKTLQDLNKRWQELDLIPDKSKNATKPRTD